LLNLWRGDNELLDLLAEVVVGDLLGDKVDLLLEVSHVVVKRGREHSRRAREKDITVKACND
jgi:hypothetical protein